LRSPCQPASDRVVLTNRAAAPLDSLRGRANTRVSAHRGRLRLRSGTLNSWTPCTQSDQRSSEGRRVHVDAGYASSGVPLHPRPRARLRPRDSSTAEKRIKERLRCEGHVVDRWLRGRCMAGPQAGLLRFVRAGRKRRVGRTPLIRPAPLDLGRRGERRVLPKLDPESPSAAPTSMGFTLWFDVSTTFREAPRAHGSGTRGHKAVSGRFRRIAWRPGSSNPGMEQAQKLPHRGARP